MVLFQEPLQLCEPGHSSVSRSNHSGRRMAKNPLKKSSVKNIAFNTTKFLTSECSTLWGLQSPTCEPCLFFEEEKEACNWIVSNSNLSFINFYTKAPVFILVFILVQKVRSSLAKLRKVEACNSSNWQFQKKAVPNRRLLVANYWLGLPRGSFFLCQKLLSIFFALIHYHLVHPM